MKRLLGTLSIVICLTTALSGMSQRQRTTIGGRLYPVEPANKEITTSVETDTITADTDAVIRLSGYDKPVNASRETMHATNLSLSDTVQSITLEIAYLDRRARQLHRRTVTVDCNIAPGTTELIAFPTWDLQRSFYYKLSAKPRRQATPYDIDCQPIRVIISKSASNTPAS